MPRFLEKLSYVAARLAVKTRPSSVRGTTLGVDSWIGAGSQVVDADIGRHSFCGYDCIILNAEIGSFCSISRNAYIGGETHPLHFVSTSPVFLSHRDSVRAKFSRHDFLELPRTTIGHDVWIGFRSIIKAGVSIGTGAIIGMGSVVTRDVPPYTIVAGTPARPIRPRFAPHIAEALLRSEWWTYDDERLKAAATLFTDPEAFLRSEGLL